MRLGLISSLARTIAFTNTEPAAGTPASAADPAPPAPTIPADAPVDPPAPPPDQPSDAPADPPAPTPEEKAAADAAAATAAAEKVAAIKTVLKLPENSTLPADAIERTAAIASELGLSPEQAQKVLELTASEAAGIRQSTLDAFAFEGAEWTRINDESKAAALADPEIGGTPEKLAASLDLAKRTMATIYGPETEQVERFLVEAGIASHPMAVKLFTRIGAKMSEGSFIRPGATGGGKKDLVSVLYGEQKAP